MRRRLLVLLSPILRVNIQKCLTHHATKDEDLESAFPKLQTFLESIEVILDYREIVTRT